MNWDYDKLFAVGNIIGVRNTILNRIFVHEVFESRIENSVSEYNRVNWSKFKNQDLSFTDFKVEYIIRLDSQGNVVEHLFDRERDMLIYEPMPELKPGMFGMTKWWQDGTFKTNDAYESGIFVVSHDGKTLIYQQEGYDEAEALIDNTETQLNGCFGREKGAVIVELYEKRYTFPRPNPCRTPLWRNPEYQKYLDSNIKE